MNNSVTEHHLNVISTFDNLESHIQKARELYSFYNIVNPDTPECINLKFLEMYRNYLSSISEEFIAFLKYYDSLVEYYNY